MTEKTTSARVHAKPTVTEASEVAGGPRDMTGRATVVSVGAPKFAFSFNKLVNKGKQATAMLKPKERGVLSAPKAQGKMVITGLKGLGSVTGPVKTTAVSNTKLFSSMVAKMPAEAVGVSQVKPLSLHPKETSAETLTLPSKKPLQKALVVSKPVGKLKFVAPKPLTASFKPSASFIAPQKSPIKTAGQLSLVNLEHYTPIQKPSMSNNMQQHDASITIEAPKGVMPLSSKSAKRRLSPEGHLLITKKAKVPRVEALQVNRLNIVSPEPRREMVNVSSRSPDNRIAGAKTIPTSTREIEHTLEISDSNSFDNTLFHPTVPSSVQDSTKQIEDLLSFEVNDKAMDDEEEEFVRRIRAVQDFIDEVASAENAMKNRLLDVHVSVSELLHDVITDLIAIEGRVDIQELDRMFQDISISTSIDNQLQFNHVDGEEICARKGVFHC
ncbi:hypothetical protein Poli38472_013555 [Pythium oligandrum]|uniref:Uncharacterized protein n=1 Tax=Pythium oligandrum TaxID=41045 RepID=A0A8K1FD97_PYTOL|nr:hypothetical protein Poli38472_013555 [Pythium oligandrum]|eukprot:TMW58081.1 hypothetical protein Poli38472_013555 [Pythium oligandrum]